MLLLPLIVTTFHERDQSRSFPDNTLPLESLASSGKMLLRKFTADGRAASDQSLPLRGKGSSVMRLTHIAGVFTLFYCYHG